MNENESLDYRSLKALSICGNFIEGKTSCNKCKSQHLCERGLIEKRIETEFAKEIFEEIYKVYDECIYVNPFTNIGSLQVIKFEQKLAELKKKYTEGKE